MNFTSPNFCILLPTQFQVCMNSPLTLAELSSNVVVRVAPNWFLLGIELSLSVDVLKMIEMDYVGQSQRCCLEMFIQWLKQPEVNPSWDKLIQALNSSSIAQRDLAQELSEKYSVTS